jgi:hypothetical protein
LFVFYLNGLVVALALSGLELAAGGRAKLSGMFRALSVGHKPEKKSNGRKKLLYEHVIDIEKHPILLVLLLKQLQLV